MKPPRGFPLWYALSLASSLGVVETARAVRAPSEVVEDRAPTEVLLALPPKPETDIDPAAGDGQGEAYTFERCETLPQDFAAACYAALARQLAERDPDLALEACEKIGDTSLTGECQADVAEGHALVNADFSRTICDRIKKPKWMDQCVFGIAMAYAIPDTAYALQTCEDSGRWKPFCRHDVNGERSVVDPPGAVAYCRSLPIERKDTCWHGIGKYIGRVDPGKALATCEDAPLAGDLRGQCIHGVGWAAAESRGSDALDLCTPLGDLRDSCVLGVAYQAKRYEPERAIELCQLAVEPTEVARCLEFVRR